MNDLFSPIRFWALFKKALLERPLQLLGIIALTMVVSLLLYATVKTIVGFEEAQNITFITGLVGGGAFLASMAFGYFSSYANGSSYLTLPASHFEKWLTAVIITGILFPCFYLAFFRMMDAGFVSSYHNSLQPGSPHYKEMFDGVFIFAFDGFVAKKTYLMFVNFVGAMLVGSLYYNKFSFIKVAFIICGLLIGGHFLNYQMAKTVFDNLEKALPYYCVFIPVNGQTGKVLLPDNASLGVDICTFFIVPAILWVVSYIRLREKEF